MLSYDDAAGAASVALCGTSDEVIPEAEKVLPSNLCPLIKSTYGFAYSQKCPFTYFSDMIIGETTCDGKKKMYELLGELKRT
ncbi:MAG: 2-hydroxyacyl-CoA dehydratase family protein, partial [Collinsella sp.]|nr:2-hydroxyacyl-CoA dehydratase family protein [Collinsella sp.]